MKIFLFVLACVPAASLALVPQVDDVALYQVTASSDNQFGKSFRHESWLKSVDDTGKVFTMVNRISRDDGFEYEVAAEVDQDFLLRSYIRDTESFCREQGKNASLEEITIPAGTFLACKLDSRSLVRWVSSQVPFGLVKSVYFSSSGKVGEEKVLLKWLPKGEK